MFRNHWYQRAAAPVGGTGLPVGHSVRLHNFRGDSHLCLHCLYRDIPPAQVSLTGGLERLQGLYEFGWRNSTYISSLIFNLNVVFPLFTAVGNKVMLAWFCMH